MQLITQCGPISRAQLAQKTGLSEPTVSEIAAVLLRAGWINVTARSDLEYEVNARAAYIASIDLGGTKVRVSVVDFGGTILGDITEKTAPLGGHDVVRQIARLCQKIAKIHHIEPGDVRLVVVGVPGVPDKASGQILMAPNIKGIEKFNFSAALSRETGAEVLVENDVNLAVLGEHWAGGGGHDTLAYVAIGTGIGAGLMVDGSLMRGATGSAGELAYLPFGADPFDPVSARDGALERVAGSAGMCARFAALAGTSITVPEIFDRVAKGCPIAAQVLDETARLLARAITSVCCIINPSAVVLGGSIGLRDEMVARVTVAFKRCFPYPVLIEKSTLKEQAALVGGVAIGLKHLYNSLSSDADDSGKNT